MSWTCSGTAGLPTSTSTDGTHGACKVCRYWGRLDKSGALVRHQPPKTVRLWWRCTLCGWKVDTIGHRHSDEHDQAAMGWDVLDHLEVKHDRIIERIPDAVALFVPAGRTTRVVNRKVLVER
jgi:hypothetical protein